MIEKVEIVGYKCLRRVTAELGPFTVLIGPNDSGKSSFLRALALPWYANEELPAGAAVSISGGGASVVWTHEDSVASLAFQSRAGAVDVGDVHKAMSTSVRPATRGVGAPTPVLPSDLHAISAFRPLVLDARRIPEMTGMGSASLDQIIEHQGRGVAAHLARLALSDRKALDALQSEMTRITRGRVADCIVDDNGDGKYSLSFRLHGGAVIPGSELSAGLLMYLGFLAILHRSDAPGVLLVEEPENGLHPLRLFEVVEILRELTRRGVQVVCTTHSPDLLSACKPDEVRVFLRPDPDSGTEIHTLPADFDRRAMRSSLGEVWASRGEEGLLDMLPRVTPTVRAEVR